jgi:hypothetical protein
MFEAKISSSLEKCFLDSSLSEFSELKEQALFSNQRFSFQLLMHFTETEEKYARLELIPVIESDISQYITVREVVNIPSDYPVYSHSDEDVLRRTPGLYPDLIRPLKYGGVMLIPFNQSRALWFTVDPKGELTGKHTVKIKMMNADYVNGVGLVPDGTVLSENEITLDFKNVALPEQNLIFSQWFYADCVADYYNVPVFSDKHFEICENFIKKAAEGGRNMMLLPLLTYALDIRHNEYRTTVQLIDVYKNGSEYTFKYDNLDRWLDICNRNGIKYYEVCHLFSQWGATATPKVMAYVDGEYKRIFGWDTDPLGTEYRTFLRAFLKGFIEHMKERGEDKKCWFHISDEPVSEHLPQYKAVKEMIADIIEGYPQFDALSHYEFYEQGIVKHPVPGTPYIKPFLENNVPDLFCYYCGGQAQGVSNCHFAMSLSRTRFIGTQLFKYKLKGFLNWGYNFYNNQWSHDHVDPFFSSTGECFGASGDTYMVYPAPDGSAWESNRFNAFYEGLEDMRAMELCASLYSHEETVNAIEEIAGTVVFDKCVCDSETMLKIRNKINDMIFERLG